MEFKIERGLRIHKLSPLKKTLNEWEDLMEVLAREWKKEDIPWWYNERAWIGVLAGTSWKAGGRAFEEFSDTKIIHRKKRKPQKKPGRVDLWLGVGTREYLIEAKHVAVNAGGNKGLTRIKDSLRAARWDLSRLRAYSGQKRLSMVCITPYIVAKKRGQINTLLSKLLNQASSIETATIAWVFPKNIRTYEWEDGYIYPGGIIVLKQLRS